MAVSGNFRAKRLSAKWNGACARSNGVWNTPAGAALRSPRHTADEIGETIASALSGVAERFHGGADAMGDEAAEVGSEAAKLGTDALRSLSKEVEHRPLVTLAVAVGVGFLSGLISRR